MSDRVTSEEMDEGNCEMPGPIGNEMPEENAGDNEMIDDGNTCENEVMEIRVRMRIGALWMVKVMRRVQRARFRLGNDRVVRRQRPTRIRCHSGLKVRSLR